MSTDGKPSCTNGTPSWFVGHWRDWHRGHNCDKDDGQLMSADAVVEIEQHAANKDTGYLTDAELRYLRTSTTSGNTLLVRALDELAARRSSSALIEALSGGGGSGAYISAYTRDQFEKDRARLLAVICAKHSVAESEVDTLIKEHRYTHSFEDPEDEYIQIMAMARVAGWS